eukprot:c21360_g1_i4.p1 GENE.c21360_g1_i4~~c21360_g1_i4.p1  ORF type:complete len:285 (-),score=66.46 c21360_g1_i4:26-880(-)
MWEKRYLVNFAHLAVMLFCMWLITNFESNQIDSSKQIKAFEKSELIDKRENNKQYFPKTLTRIRNNLHLKQENPCDGVVFNFSFPYLCAFNQPRLILILGSIEQDPTFLGFSSTLSVLVLYDVQPPYRIPSEIGLFNELIYLVGYRSISGTLPSQIGLLSSLNLWIFDNNVISGTIPTEIGKLVKLTQIVLSYAEFSGEIPSHIGLLTKLSTFHLLKTNINGNVPTEMSNLSSLIDLMISASQINYMCSELGLLSNLEFFHLGSNRLIGEIPSEIGMLTRLTTV